MTKEKATTIIENCKEQWQMLLREDLCDETEGRELVEAFDMALSALSENRGGWIPIEEREPDPVKVVFLSLQSSEVVKGWKSKMIFHGEQCYYDCNAEDYIARNSVLAWQPLPEPYEKGDIE